MTTQRCSRPAASTPINGINGDVPDRRLRGGGARWLSIAASHRRDCVLPCGWLSYPRVGKHRFRWEVVTARRCSTPTATSGTASGRQCRLRSHAFVANVWLNHVPQLYAGGLSPQGAHRAHRAAVMDAAQAAGNGGDVASSSRWVTLLARSAVDQGQIGKERSCHYMQRT